MINIQYMTIFEIAPISIQYASCTAYFIVIIVKSIIGCLIHFNHIYYICCIAFPYGKMQVWGMMLQKKRGMGATDVMEKINNNKMQQLLTVTVAAAQRNSPVLLPNHESNYFTRTLRSHLHWPIFKDIWFS